MTHAGSPAARPGLVDFHCHSTASDGLRAPEDVVAEAVRVGLVALALTDHDTLGGVAAARSAASSTNLRIVAGVELSAVEESHETHILGLHLANFAPIETRLQALRDMRRGRADEMVKRLNEIGVRITFQSVLDQAAGAAIGRPHIARALVAEGWATDLRDAFDRYLGAGRPAFVPKDQLSMPDAISIIHEAGGLAIMAHPAQAGTHERLAALAAQGLDGVEVLHPSHSPEDIARLSRIVETIGLLPSGGSDWHGTADGGRALGCMRVPAEWLTLHDARLAQGNLA